MTNLYSELMLPLYEKYGEAAAIEPRVEDSIKEPLETPPISQLGELHRKASTELQSELLAYIHAQGHRFFENLIIDVLLAMGYGHRRRDLARHLGRSHDGGIDGVIAQDELGLDLIMLQAKRLKPGSVVSAAQLRDFAGGLEAQRASKGIFVTTTQFSSQAQRFAQSVTRRIVLLNGQQLTHLMIRHNIGVKVTESFVFKEIDGSYFATA